MKMTNVKRQKEGVVGISIVKFAPHKTISKGPTSIPYEFDCSCA